jgi:hypothetical protein
MHPKETCNDDNNDDDADDIENTHCFTPTEMPKTDILRTARASGCSVEIKLAATTGDNRNNRRRRITTEQQR